MKPKSSDLELYSQRYPIFKISDILKVISPYIFKLSNFTLYFKSNCTNKLMPTFGLKINNRWSNVKLKGQMMM